MDRSRKEIQDDISLLLAEKRTSLAVLRTAIAVFTLPLSVFTILVATSRYYNTMESLHLILPLIIISSVLIIIGIYLIYRSFNRIRIIDNDIKKLKNHTKTLV
jgi:uncharacterized membrane protein YidH (DUF202 family)